MRQMIYISSATTMMSEGDVDAILHASRINNAACGVTGLLLYDGRRFLQALEGDTLLVERTFQRIKADPRHRAIVQLSSADVEARAFGRWAMAAERATSREGSSVADAVDQLTEHVADANVRALFRSFARVRVAA